MNVDDAGGGNGGWGELKFPKGNSNHLNQAWLAIGNSSGVICGGGAGEFSAADFTLNKPGGDFDQNSTANFTGTNSGIELRVHQRAYMNANSTGVLGHAGGWLVVEYNIYNKNTTETARNLHLMQYSDWKVNQTNDNTGYERFDDKNMSVVYELSSNESYYLATAQIAGEVKGHNAGVFDPLLNGGVDSSIWTNMAAPGNDTSAKTTQNWYTDLIAFIGDIPPGERSTVAFVFLAGNSTDELNNSYLDAMSAYHVPALTGPIVSGGAWKTGTVKVSTNATDVSPGKVVQAEFAYSADSTTGYDGSWTPVYGSPLNNSPYELDWNTLNATTATDASVWVRARAKDDYGRFSVWHVLEVKVDNEAPTTTHDYDGQWHNTDITITLTPDDNGGSGVSNSNIFYKINDGVQMNVGANTQPVIITESASNKLEFWSEDALGATEIVTNVLTTIKLDKTVPAFISWQLEPADVDEDTAGPLNVTVEIDDSLSGISATVMPMLSHRIRPAVYGPSFPMNFAGPAPGGEYWNFTVPEPAGGWDIHQENFIDVKVKITDEAGLENEQTTSDIIEIQDDTVDIELTKPDPGLWYSNDVEVAWEVIDTDGRIQSAEIQYSLDGVVWQSITSFTSSGSVQWQTAALGELEDEHVWLRAFATVENLTTSQVKSGTFDSMKLKLDNKAPEIITLSTLPANLTVDHVGSIALELEVTDSGTDTNEAMVKYKLGDGPYTEFLMMSRAGAGNDHWEFLVPEPPDNWIFYVERNLSLTFKLSDVSGNEAELGEYIFKFHSPPIVPLVIVHTPQESAVEGGHFTVTANITGGNNPQAAEAVCYYKYVDGDIYQSVSLNLVGSNATTATFESVIPILDPYPGSGGNAKLYYYISATEGGSTGTSPTSEPNLNPHELKILTRDTIGVNHIPPKGAMVNKAVKIKVLLTGVGYDVSVILHYRNISAADYDTKKMERELFGELGSYATVLPAQTSPGLVYYFFEVVVEDLIIFDPVNYFDSAYRFRVHSSDKPTVLHTPPKTTYVGMKIIISATIYDNNGIVSASMNYKLSSMDDFLPKDMTRISGDILDGIYTAEIPKQNRPTTIYYYIEARDGANTGSFPVLNASGNPLKLDIIEYPNYGPQVEGYAPTPPEDINAGEWMIFNVSATDPDGNDSDITYRWFVDDLLMPGDTSDNFNFTTGLDDEGQHTVRVEITDGNGTNLNFSWSLTINPAKSPKPAESSNFSSVSMVLIIIVIIMALLLIFFNLRIRRSFRPVKKDDGEEEEELDEEENHEKKRKEKRERRKEKRREIQDAEEKEEMTEADDEKEERGKNKED